MSDVFRHRVEGPGPRVYPVESATIISIGDMLWKDNSGYAKPASDYTWDTDLLTTQKQFALQFIGVAAQASAAGSTTDIRVDTQGVFNFTCAATTFINGDPVGPAKASGNTLENQKVAKVATDDAAIGLTYEHGASVTVINVEVASADRPANSAGQVGFGDCESACQFGCESTCQFACESTCQGPCESACQGACESACQWDCESACQGACESACQWDCESACQGACESACQYGCETGEQT